MCSEYGDHNSNDSNAMVVRNEKSSMRGDRTYRSPNDPAQRVPGSLIKPVEEIVESLLHHVMRGAVVKPAKIRRSFYTDGRYR